MLTLKIPWYSSPAHASATARREIVEPAREEAERQREDEPVEGDLVAVGETDDAPSEIDGRHLASELDSRDTRSASAWPSEAIPPSHGYQKCDVAPTCATSSVSAPVTIRSTSGVGTRRPIQLKSMTDGSTVQIFRAYGIISRSAMPSPNIARIHCS